MPRSVLLHAVGGCLVAVTAAFGAGDVRAAAPEPSAVIKTYADIAQAAYEDSLIAAKRLRDAVDALVASPSAEAMQAARAAWIAARPPYQQTEVFRFGNPIVDDWEGKVNAWPLDEGLIDYVDGGYGTESDGNPFYTANIIAHPKFQAGGTDYEAGRIDARLLESLHEAGGVEANVAIGYHAAEFLLWGQDLNGTAAGAGERPWTDYAEGDACTHGNCERRGQCLAVASEMLVDELDWMTKQWTKGGAARTALQGDEGISAIVTGLGSLAYGELAGERMKLGLLLNDPEEEHDCFSDNTHNSHFYDVVGMRNVYLGSYMRIDGTKVEGPGLSALVAAKDPALDAEMRAKLTASYEAFSALKRRAETVEAYDQMIGAGNAEGNAVVEKGIAALTDQTRSLERVVAALDLQLVSFEGSDSLDNPANVFK